MPTAAEDAVVSFTTSLSVETAHGFIPTAAHEVRAFHECAHQFQLISQPHKVALILSQPRLQKAQVSRAQVTLV